MSVLRYIFNIILNILNHSFIVFGVRTNLLAVLIGSALLLLVCYFIYSVFVE